MPLVGFEPTIPVSEEEKTVHVLDRSATVTGFYGLILHNITGCKCILLNKMLVSNLKLRGFSPQAKYTTKRPPLVGDVSANFSG
jgi:hypothetical protein